MRGRRIARGLALFVGFLVHEALVWDGGKLLGGAPWRFGSGAGEVVYQPPFEWKFATDRALPHIWEVAGALVAPVQREQTQSMGEYLVGAAVYTGQEAVLGFLFGAVLGLTLAAVFV